MARQLTLSEREQIAQFRLQGLSRADIGRQLGRHRSTIGRELRRNSDGASYWASTAQQKCQARRRHRPRKLDDEKLNAFMRRGLAQCWSPEQIAGSSRLRFRQQPRRWVSHTTIYRWIAADPYRRYWESLLRFGRRRRQPETRGKLPREPRLPVAQRSWTSEAASAIGKETRSSASNVVAAWSRWSNARAGSLWWPRCNA